MNYSDFENPQVIKYVGKAKLFKDDFEIDVEFRYYLINEKGVLFCTSFEPLPVLQRIALYKFKWTIIGLTEGGISFRSLDLLITNFDGEKEFEFVPQKDIIISEILTDKTNDAATYKVLNLFTEDLKFNYKGFSVDIENISSREHELIEKYWQIPQFTSIIKLTKKGEVLEEYDKLINSIIMLLTLATGKSLSFPVKEFEKAGGSVVLINNARPTSRKIQSIIPQKYHAQYLAETIPFFNEEFDTKYIEFRTLFEYVNDTDKGYLDDRILSMIQAWEIVANNWGEKYEIPEEINELKENFKPVIKEWHNKYPHFDKGMISQRISDSLIWDKTINRLNNLLTQNGFNRDVLDVDFKSLVQWRHKVAHEGMLRSTDNNEVADKLLDAQLAFRLLLLRRIGYTGKVIPNKGHDTQKEISYYFNDYKK
ncbi:MAG: hypothetical protein HQ522_07975 [Bacteroidetes bacterium]|nr:hypothetical protein [Bacteroidota bacterium]